MVEKTRNILTQIYARHLTTIGQINFTFREIELIARLIHTRGIKKIALLMNISPKTAGTHIRNISLKINCNSQDGIIKFIENSGKLEIIKEFYNTIIHPTDLPTNVRTPTLINDETQTDLSQGCVAALPAEPAFILRSLKNPISWIHPKFSLKAYIFIFLTILMICLLVIIPYHYYSHKEELSVRSDLIVPMNAVLLQRSDLMGQIDKKFTKEPGIQSLALIGPGGAGKTITARQYAQQQHTSVVWEINAENRRSLYASFENLAATLSKTEEDGKELIQVQGIRDEHKREEKLIQFVKNRLKILPHWFLIFDNIAQFTNIQFYFPQDGKTWGQGKIILTTQDKNIENNNQINHIVLIEELDPVQKLNLFTKILSQGMSRPLTEPQLEEAKQFLENIPSFPLDVSSAAYYLNATHISYQKYLENLKNYHQDFANVQENLLKEAGPYVKTRYEIITLSLEQLLNSHKDFGELLLFISLLDSQNIPSDLLKTYKNDAIVDNFMYHLKKYSLITNSSSLPQSTFSIHRSTQDIIRAYLSDSLKLKKESPILTPIVYALDDYLDQAIEREDFANMQVMAIHLEKFLNHPNLLTDFSKGLLESKLGSIYFFISDEKAKQILDSSLKELTSDPLTSNARIARSLLHIGAAYTELRHDEQAEKLFEKVITIYGDKGLKNYSELSWALSHLGNLHRRLKNYEEAQGYLEKSIQLQKQHSHDKKRLARTLAYLGGVYRGLGFYQKSIDSLQESLTLYNKNFANDYFRIGWILTQLGNVYRELGNDEKAKEYLERGLLVFQKHLPENHVDKGLALAYLGNYCREQGDYQKSRDYLEQSLKIYQKYFDEKHARMGWVLFHLASTYKALGDDQKAQHLFDRVFKTYTTHCSKETLEASRLLREMAEVSMRRNHLDEAKNFIKRSLKILTDRNHIDAYKSLEVLGEIYLKKTTQSPAPETQQLKAEALGAFNQALKIIENNFPKDSVHVDRIRSKVKKAQG